MGTSSSGDIVRGIVEMGGVIACVGLTWGGGGGSRNVLAWYVFLL